MFPGLRFETRAPAARASTARADVACFVGFVRVRDAAEDLVRAEYDRLGWRGLVPAKQSGENTLDGASLPPFAVESALAFDALFDGWVTAAIGRTWEGALSGAVHDFFRQGGRRAWIVPVGAPFADEDSSGAHVDPPVATLHARITAVVPGADGQATLDAGRRATWRGLAHLLGLPEVSIACLPDLPWLVGAPTTPEPPLPSLPVGEPMFVECSEPSPAPPARRAVGAPGAPRLGDAEMGRWQVAVAHAIAFVKRYRPDTQLVLALPLRVRGHAAEADPLPDLLQAGMEGNAEVPRSHSRLWRHGASRQAALRAADRQQMPAPSLLQAEGKGPDGLPGIGSAFLQLSWPWYGGDGTLDRPDGLGAPDGLVAGLVARATLLRGAFRTTAGERAEGVAYLEPQPAAVAVHRALPAEEGTEPLSLTQRVALLQRAPGRFVLGSDPATTSEPRWRQAGTNRLYGVVLRLLREVGETMVFEPSSEATWAELRGRVESVLAGLVAVGALTGPQPYAVRCDRTTMSQQDIDSGRLVALVDVAPAPAIERITVVLVVSDASSAEIGGMVS